MHQPPELKTSEFAPWTGGSGEQVWAMLCAAADGDLVAVQKLAAADPKLVQCEYAYRRPLYFAVRENHVAVAEFLLRAGADPSNSGFGDSLLLTAHERGYSAIAALLKSHLIDNFAISPEGEFVPAAIRERDLARVKTLLDEHPEWLHTADQRGNQPLHWAVMTRQLSLIELLLARGADINARRPDGARPLDLTNGDYWHRGWRDVPPQALAKHEVLIGFLVARGADYDISVAAKIGDAERVRELLNADPDAANRVPAYSTYYSGLPLRNAAGAGHLAVVKLLLERGANPNEPEPIAPRGGALHSALGGGHFEIAKMLLEHGADPNAPVESSGNCMHIARKHGQAMVELLAAYGGALGVEISCYEGDVVTLAAMLHANPQLTISQDDFHYACREGRTAIVQLLLRHDADLAKRMRFDGAKSVELARLVLEAGADPKTPDWLGTASLHQFAKDGRCDMAALALEFGANINARDEEYRSTPLGWAARCGQRDMVEFLLNRGAAVQLPDDEPWATPLVWAQKRGHAEIGELLRNSQGRECAESESQR